VLCVGASKQLQFLANMQSSERSFPRIHNADELNEKKVQVRSGLRVLHTDEPSLSTTYYRKEVVYIHMARSFLKGFIAHSIRIEVTRTYSILRTQQSIVVADSFESERAT
jgi:hypothetical protein